LGDGDFLGDVWERALADAPARPSSRLGCAVDRAWLLAHGRFPGAGELGPEGELAALALSIGRRLGVPHALESYARYVGSRRSRRFRPLILEREGWRTLKGAQALRFTRWLWRRVWEAPEPRAHHQARARRWLMEGRIVAPRPSTLARWVGKADARARRRFTRQLAARVPAELRGHLLAMVETDSLAAPFVPSPFAQLCRRETRVGDRAMGDVLERMVLLGEYLPAGVNADGLPMRRVRQRARWARVSGSSAVIRMAEPEQVATLAAFAIDMRDRLHDEVLGLLDQLMVKKRRAADQLLDRERAVALTELAQAGAVLATVAELVMASPTGDAALRGRVREAVGDERLAAAIQGARAGIAPVQPEARRRAQVQRGGGVLLWVDELLDQVRFEGAASATGLLTALAFLRRSLTEHWTVMDHAPSAMLDEAWRNVMAENPRGARRVYAVATLEALVRALRRREVWVRWGRRWRDPRRHVLHGAPWQRARSAFVEVMALPTQPEVALERWRRWLVAAYAHAGRVLPGGATELLVQEGGHARLRWPVDPAEDEPPGRETLRLATKECLPPVRLPALVLEVDRWTGFLDDFVPIGRAGRVRDVRRSLCALLVAEACNLGMEPVIDATDPALRRDRLRWVRDQYIRARTLRSANATLVARQLEEPLPRLWGDGFVASADGMRLVAGKPTLHAGENPRYFGRGRGATWYNMLGDVFAGLHDVVVPGTSHDAAHALECLLEQRTMAEPKELATDSAGHSDMVAGLAWLLGFQLSPRWRDPGGMRLWRLDPAADHGPLGDLARGRVSARGIELHWEDVLRIAEALHRGRVGAVETVRMLQHGGRPTSLGRAIRDIGRIARTLTVLALVSSEAYRRRVRRQLNQSESRHAMARAVFFGQRGQLRRSYREGQEDQLGALGLLLNAIVLWNTRYLHSALLHLERQGYRLDPDDVAHLTPLSYGHINVVGHYRFELTSPPDGALRSLPKVRTVELPKRRPDEDRAWRVADLEPRKKR
jgi:TnpA family transposase